MFTKDVRELIIREGGVSIRPDGTKPLRGFMVSKAGYETIVTCAEVEKGYADELIRLYLSFAANSEDTFFGAWRDTTGKVYFDLSVNVPTLDLALVIAKENKQLAVYDLEAGESIYL